MDGDPLVRLFSTAFRNALEQSGVRPVDVTNEAVISRTLFYKIRDGDRLPGPEVTRRCDHIFGTGTLLTSLRDVVHDEQRKRRAGSGAGGDEEVERRSFLQVAAALGIESSSYGAALETIRQGLDATTSDPESWDEIAVDYGYAYMSTDPMALSRELAGDLMALWQRIEQTESPGLQAAAAKLSVIMAMTLANLHAPRKALRWWQTARRLSEAAGDHDLALWVRGRESVRADDYSASRVLALTANALDQFPTRPCVGLAGLLSGRAQVQARLGDRAGARDSLVRLLEVHDQLPDEASRDLRSLYSWSDFRLQHAAAYVHTRNGDIAEALTAIDAAQAFGGQAVRREQALCELYRAECLVCQGSIREGIDHALKVISDLPEEHRTAVILESANTILEQVPRTELSRRPVVEFRDITRVPQVAVDMLPG